MVLTSSTSLQDAVDAMKQGAKDFVVKDFDADFKSVLSLSLSRVAQGLQSERNVSGYNVKWIFWCVSIENNQDGLALVDAAGVIVYGNRAFQAFARRCGGEGKGTLGELFLYEFILKSENVREALTRTLQYGGLPWWRFFHLGGI